ncbi:MAG: DUF4856 domain-containing protein [Deltaproteobacteria bacterium]|nr:DUF4856 domain-containing protein [Deltaproteobacteria bacterium]
MQHILPFSRFFPLAAFAFLVGCPGPIENVSDAGENLDDTPQTYVFSSRFDENHSAVSYSGQLSRHALIKALKDYIGSIDDDTYTAGVSAAEVKANFRFFADYKNQGGNGEEQLPYSLVDVDEAAVSTLQVSFSDIGSPVSLEEKLPDADVNFGSAGWSDGFSVAGYGAGTLSPTAVLDDMLQNLAVIVANRADGIYEKDPAGADIEEAFLSSDGIDYQQLIQKYLDGAILYSQATDDYLDDDIDGKGLLSDNVLQVEKAGVSEPFTSLEHSWDEAFGYFGAARDYGEYSDEEIAGKGGRPAFAKGFYDSDDDGRIDLVAEINQGHCVNAAKRDRGSSFETDFTQEAFSAFIEGRHLIASTNALSDDDLLELRAHRDAALGAWEKAIAATVVHYLNEVLVDMDTFGTSSFSFAGYAKHFSEGLGFALALQFNPRGALSRGELEELYRLVGRKPVAPGADASSIAEYKQALQNAKSLIASSFDFHDDNMGDAAGNGGW